MASITVLDRPYVRALVPALSDARTAFDEARAARDPLRAAGLALAARLADADFRLTPDDLDWLLSRLTDKLLLPCLVGCCEEPCVDVLVRLLGRQPVPNTRYSAILTAAIRLDGAPPPPELVRETRLAALEARGYVRVVVGAACGLLADESLREATEGLREWAELVGGDHLVASFKRLLSGDLGDEVLQDFGSAGMTRQRAGPKVGRNDPCPCGSGKKHKKCCEGKAVEYVAKQPAAQLPIPDRHLHELVALDPGSLGTDELEQLAESLAQYGLLEEAEAAFEVLSQRPDLDCPVDDCRHTLVLEATERGDVALVRRHLLACEEDTLLGRCAPGLLAALDERLDPLEACCRDLLEDRGMEVEFSAMLIDLRPALGVLFARAALGSDRLLDSETLLGDIRSARLRLELPPEDRFEELWDSMFEAEDEDEGDEGENESAEEARRLRSQLADSAQQARELQTRLREAEQLLEEARAVRPKAEEREAHPAEIRRLRDRVTRLKQMVAERNEERADLRRQLRAPAREEPAFAAAEPEDEDGYDVPSARRPPLIPRFAREAEDDLRELPAAPARVAMKQLGGLCAGDDLAWSKVKRLQAVEGVHSVRLGLHHRMLFTFDLEARTLEVVRAIARESQETVLRQLRRVGRP